MFPIVFQEIIVKVPLNQLPWLYDIENSTAEFFDKAFLITFKKPNYLFLSNYSYEVWKILENQFTYGFLHSNRNLATLVDCGDRHFSADITRALLLKFIFSK